MAKFYIDASIETEKGDMVKEDGTSEDLTGSVRIVYDDTLDKRQLGVLIDRIWQRINETELQ